MSEYLKTLITHIRPELLLKWFAVGGLAFLGTAMYDYATKGSDIFFEDGDAEDLIPNHNEDEISIDSVASSSTTTETSF